MDTLWWKFEVPGLGTHQVRVKNIGARGQEVSIDGNPVAAPDDQLIFTGPGATLLELQRRANGWVLVVDGMIVESHQPEQDRQALLWKFALPGIGTHQLRIKAIGEAGQEVFMDGSPVEAPPGTTTFTGPGACLLQISKGGGQWSLHVDGVYCPQSTSSPSATSSAKTWEFVLPSTGAHTVSAVNLGLPGHQVFIDGVSTAAPEGTTTFTGPEGVLLQFQNNGDSWILYVDGNQAQETEGGGSSATSGSALWNFSVMDPSKTFSSMHQMQVRNMGVTGQEVFLDGVLVPAPEGTTMFTGPVGCLLEVQLRGSSWALQVDGVDVEAHNTAIMMSGAATAPPGVREAVAPVTMIDLPQGVTLDPSTGKYTANIRVHGRFVNLGIFATPDEASNHYQQYKKAHGA